MTKKHSKLERALAKLIHNCKHSVKLEDLEKDALTVTETEMLDIGEFHTVDSLYLALFNEAEAPYDFEYKLNRTAAGQTINHRGLTFTVLRTEPESKTLAIETVSKKEYVCKLSNICVDKLLLTIN